ncbi:MAG: hypothetical protein ABIQ43_05785 [Sphingomonas sp.]
MTVPQVIAQIDGLNGKTVSVRGYLGQCSGYTCGLFVDRVGHDAWYRYMDAISRRERPPIDNTPRLGIGAGKVFDAKAASLQNSFVIITGKVTNMCRDNGRPACTDRTTDLEPTDIAPLKDK